MLVPLSELAKVPFVKNPLRKKTVRVGAICLASILVAYLILGFTGGGWSPRLDDTFQWDGDSMLLFAHRGLGRSVPENSLAAFAEARQLGFKAVELDIRKTKDGQLAILHDPTPKRTLGLDVRFGDLTLAEIKQRRMLFKGQETTNYIPTLREVFEAEGKNLRFYLDMKEKKFRDADQIASLIQEFDLYDRTILASVDPLFVVYVEHKYPRINTTLERFDTAQSWLYRLIPKRWKPDYLSGDASKADCQQHWLKENNLLSKRIVYSVDRTTYQLTLNSGIRKAIVDNDFSLYSDSLSKQVPSYPHETAVSTERLSEPHSQ